MPFNLLMAVGFALWFMVPALAHQQTDQTQSPTPPFDTSRPRVLHHVRGRVYLPNGHAAESYIRLTLRLTRQEIVWEGYTDSNGYFELKQIPNNSYELVAWGSEDFETTVERFDLVDDIAHTETVNVYLRPKEKRSTPSPAVVSVSTMDPSIPGSARKEYRRGQDAAGKNRPEDAIRHYQRAIEIHERFPEAHNDLGVQYLRLERLDEACGAFLKALRYNPTLAKTHLNVGQVYVRLKDFAAATQSLTRAVELDPSDWQAHAWLGVSLMESAEDGRAESELRQALDMSKPPEGSFIHLYLANLYIRRGNIAQAIIHGDAYLKEFPNGPDAAAVRERIEQMRSQTQ